MSEKECRLVVCHRGYIFIGYVSRREGPIGPEIIIERAKNLRRWGTTRGLGELVDGPTPNTVLDDAPQPVCLHPLQIIWSGPVNSKLWEEHLAPAR